jgi:outer membrane protein assembly factor BamD (BamD/ComL family)
MDRWSVRLLVVLAVLFAWPLTCPAPLVYTPGEGWSYEPVGGRKWQKARAKDQFEVAREAYDQKQYNVAVKAARRTVKVWPLSDYAPQAQYLMGRAYEARRMDERAFKAYQQLLEKYPKVENYEEVLGRQFEIANRYLAGQWFKLWGYIPFFPSMQKTAAMYETVIKNGPYSDIAPTAQMNIGAAHEKRAASKVEKYSAAVKAYERAADRYHDQKAIASDALYKAGLAYFKQAKTSEYDQSISAQAIATFNDFITLHPDDARVGEAQALISQLRTEQARGSYRIARYYEKKRQWDGALVYYNEVELKDRDSPFAEEARQRVEAINRRKSHASEKSK